MFGAQSFGRRGPVVDAQGLSFMLRAEPCLHEIRHVLYILFPVFEGQTHILVELIHHFLDGVVLDDQSGPLIGAKFEGLPDQVHVVLDLARLLLGVVGNHSLEDLVTGAIIQLGIDIPLHVLDLAFKVPVVFVHGNVELLNGLFNFFVQVLEETVHQSQDLFLGFSHFPAHLLLIE